MRFFGKCSSLLVLTAFTCLLFIPSSARSEPANIFGADDRIPVISSEYPWSAIGKVMTDNGGCTGTLVGKDLVLTAAHCILDDEKNEPIKGIYFYPNLIDGKAKMNSYAIEVTYGASYPDFSYADWAIIKLKDPLGDYYGYMGVQAGINSIPYKVHSVGYSGNFRNGLTAGLHVGCSIWNIEANLYNHDCDQSSGGSGGPIFIVREKQHYIVGIMVSEQRYTEDDLDKERQLPYSEDKTNHAVRAVHFQPSVSSLRKPSEEKKPEPFAMK